MPPLTFIDIDAVPDILTTNRYTLYFPNVTGVDGYALTLRSAEVSLPARSIGQRTAKYLGHPIHFAGGNTSDPTFTVDLFEDVTATSIQNLMRWHNLCRRGVDGSTARKQTYASAGLLNVYDTTGAVALKVNLLNMWPTSIQLPQLGEDTAPFKITSTWSVDIVEVDMNYVNGNVAPLLSNGFSSSFSALSNSVLPVLNLSTGSLITNGADLTAGISIGSNGINAGLTMSLGAFSMNFSALF